MRMWTRRYGMELRTLAARLVVTACIAGLAITALPPAGVHAQQATTATGLTAATTFGSPFEMTGFIQAATVDTPGDVLSGGVLTVNNHRVTVPRNTILQMPATALTWQELFTKAPAPYGFTGGVWQTGLALSDNPRPLTTYEVTVQGNRVGDTYIAALIFFSQLSLHTHDGYINFIDYATGELRVGGTPGVATTGVRVQVNDPIGRFGRAVSPDVRFTIDEENPTIKTETAYPMCIPRKNPFNANGTVNAAADDPLCPQGNRPQTSASTPTAPRYQPIFTMPARPAVTPAQIANPATRVTPALAGSPCPLCDPWRMAPFEVGDFVTFKGTLMNDGSDFYSVWGIDANVGIFTTEGALPVYVAVDVLLMGSGPSANAVLVEEAAKRFRMEGFTTDPSRPVNVFAVDVDPCSGDEVNRFWATQQVDPGPPSGAVRGRWRFRPAAPLFDLKGFPFLPATREAVAYSTPAANELATAPTVPISCQTGVCNFAVPTVTTLNGLTAGQYTLPNFEFIFGENVAVGAAKVPGNYDTMRFLAQGSGPWNGDPSNIAGQLNPWPGTIVPAPFVNSVTGLGCSASPSSGPTVQASVSVDSAVGVAGPLSTTAFSTAVGGEVLVALAASDGPPTGANTQNLTISGAGLNWTRVLRAATARGDSEIWTAIAPTPLTNVKVTSTQSAPVNGTVAVAQTLTVVAFTNASGVGASTAASRITGAPGLFPTATLTAQAGSIIYGVGNDFDRAKTVTVPANQTLIDQTTTASNDTFWVQRLSAASAGGSATLSAVLSPGTPASDQWNFAIVEIKR
jgi:hypothetical protein